MTDSVSPPPAGETFDPVKLRKTLEQVFSLSDLQILCRDLSIDYENLAHTRKNELAFELVEHCLKLKLMKMLVDTFLEKAPHIPRQSLLSTSNPGMGTSSRRAFSADAAFDKSKTMIAGQSFTALIHLLSQPDVRTAVVSFQTDFEAASRQIDLLNDYKLAHDYFQELENRYFLLFSSQRRLPADETAWEDVAINEPEVYIKINDLLKVSQRATFATDEMRWIKHLSQAQSNIRKSTELFEYDLLKDGMGLLLRILNRQPTRLNAQLVATANLLRLDTLESAMQTISTNLASSDIELDVVGEVSKGVEALAGLDSRLRSLVKDHNAWQELDDEMRQVGSDFNQLIDDLNLVWIDLLPMTQALTANREDTWAIELNDVLTNLSDALQQAITPLVSRHFSQFRTKTERRFRDVDLELLTLCQELQRVGESLDLLLRQFNK